MINARQIVIESKFISKFKEHNAVMEITALAPAITVTNKQIIILLNFIISLEIYLYYIDLC